jgi:hypothetical protein
MSTLHGKARIDPDGTLRIHLPPSCANNEIEYVLEFHAPGTNGQLPPATTRRRYSGQARRDVLRRVAGSIDDPTFQRPPQGTPEPREPLE